ncbi:acetylxylan esterase [Parasediminibacterium sp. JCM 36343]|uniref:acetylxylan esterase n=1 Tax=Parasediminibacterium sp. JCM 36343 TaxID=3374279 RepID=UPI003979CB1B
MKHTLKLWLSSWLLISNIVMAQVPQAVKIIVAPSHTDWKYNLGEKATFSVTVIKNGNPLPNTRIAYEIGPEKQPPTKIDSATLANGKMDIEGGTLKVPGFLRCTVTAYVDGFKYSNLATAGYNPEDIKPTVTMPTDFDSFWDVAKKSLAKVPIDAKMRLLPERCTGNVNVYEVSLGNINNTRFYGILCVPKKEGKYPALFIPPGAGVRAYYGEVGLAEKGVITFQVGIHGIPVTLDDGVYSNLGVGALKGYAWYGLDDKNNYYYKRVYLGCVRSIDFLTSLPQYDGQNIGVTGGSQGGALTIVTAALDSRVKVLAAHYPALADLTGFLHGRAGGWPLFFYYKYDKMNNEKDKVETIGYYDVVNFAKSLKVEGLYTWGYNDDIVPPTSMYAAYNSIIAPKQLILNLETGHYDIPETVGKMNDWILGKLKAGQGGK